MPSNGLPLPLNRQQEIADALKSGKSHRQIARELGVHPSTVNKLAASGVKVPEAAEAESLLHKQIRENIRRGPLSIEEIADRLDCGPGKIKSAIAEMEAAGAMLLKTADGRYELGSSIHLEPGRHEVAGSVGEEWTHRFGVTTDNHLCNRHSRLDVLHEAYDHFEREGITRVFNCGNWIDGEARFNKTELVTAPGMDNQLDYLIDKWPVRPGITTEFIAGDDHEGWYQQREGIEVGRYLEMRARRQGRTDLNYLGYGECDVSLSSGIGSGSAVMRVVHPGGGSAYAISYTDQKRTESYQGGEKPQIELVGHYHKFNQGYPREVHTVQCGCTCDQTMFMRKKRLQAHVGFVTVKIKQDESGVVTRFAVEWHPRFDRKFYEKRF